jgi:hypothetical protein
LSKCTVLFKNAILLTTAADGRPQNKRFFTDVPTTSLNFYSLTTAPNQRD